MELNAQAIAIFTRERYAKREVLAHLPNKHRDLAPWTAYILIGDTVGSGPSPDAAEHLLVDPS